jgi:D-psicose/D-tagatose/L-ribulose 3-epimerase
MKLGVTAYIWAAEFTTAELRILPRLRAHGFDGIEIPVFRPRAFDAPAIRRGLEQEGVACEVSAALVAGLSLASDDGDVRRRTRQHLVELIETAAALGASIIAGPLYTPVGDLPGRRRTSDEWQRVVEAYQSLVPVLDAHDVTIAIEPLNRFETYFLNTVADGLALCDQIASPRVGLLFDTFHANIEEKDIAVACGEAARHLKHVHTSENDRGTPGSGHVDWPGVFGALRAQQYDGWLTIESFGFALGDLSAAASIWRDIEANPESIAFDGVRFLQKNIGR